MKLPKLNSVKQCPKCLFEITSKNSKQYYKSKQLNETHNQCWPDNPHPTIDCMERICGNCGYQWFEQCADYQENQGEVGSNTSEACIEGGIAEYPEMFSKEHFQEADKIRQTIIDTFKQKGITKASSTKCPASQNFLNLNHYSLSLYCCLPRGHEGKHQIRLKSDIGESVFEWLDTESDKDSITILSARIADKDLIALDNNTEKLTLPSELRENEIIKKNKFIDGEN